MKWIEAGDIKNWVNGKQRHCQQTLPELILRLISATASSIEEIIFPYRDNISTSGWDGRLRTPVISPFFPSGQSGWEIGTDKSPGKKAEGDYEKRTTDPLGIFSAESTFVFVTPRLWPRRNKWATDKKADSKWKDVRVIGSIELEQWLDSAPAVALWLAKQIGKVIEGGIRDIGSFWEEWSLATNPVMTTDLVISGRIKEMDEIHKWITGRPGILEMQGDSPDETFAFLYAAIIALSEIERVKALSRCVVVETLNELRACTQAFQNPLIIAAPGQCIEAAGAAISKGHHVFLSMDSNVIDIGRILRLSRPKGSIVEKNLRDNGFSDADAQQLARDFGRSIPVLRRRLFVSKAVSAPVWANAESAQLLITVLFAGSWAEEKDGDRKVIEALSGMKYDAFVKELEGFLAIDDPPIHKVGTVWMLKSPLDAWFLLARHLDNASLKLFQQSIHAVLTETDPKYDLPANKRWAAAIYDKSSQYSEWIRKGLVESLVLLAVYGDRSPNVPSTQGFANHIVKDILAAAQKWEAWASLNDVTPLLAEAAPDMFIEVLEEEIEKNPDLFRELMRDDGDAVFGECKHSGLLWALESLAWSSDYIARAVQILSHLSAIDPGGRWANRPIACLRDIFYPDCPQTYATPEERLEMFNTLIESDPKLVWQFAQSYFNHGMMSGSHQFRWRNAGGERLRLESDTIDNYREYLKGFLSKISDLACLEQNLVASTDDFTRFSPDIQERLLTTLESVDPVSFSKEDRDKLLKNIRDAMHWINSHGKEIIRIHLPALNRILTRFAPDDILERVGWLLSTPWPLLPEGEPREYDARNTAIKTAQEKATREVLDNASLSEILEFAGTIQSPGVLGHALGMVVRDENEDASVLDAILGLVAEIPILIRGYTDGRVKVVGTGWIDQQIERLKAEGKFSAEACALLYFGLPESAVTWSLLSIQGKDVENAYWKQASGRSQTGKEKDAAIAIEKLLDVKRPAAALEIAGDPKVSVSSLLLKRLIQELLSLDSKDRQVSVNAMTAFHLGYVFNQLYDRNEMPIDEIARLEWPFASLFNDLRGYISMPLAIHRILQQDPTLFSQLISYMYKRDDDTLDPNKEGISEEHLRNMANSAKEILRSWRLIPGLKDDGTLYERELIMWVESARHKYAQNKYITGGDLQIAELLSRAPSDPDGIWPHTAVRNLIERLSNQLIDDHIQIGICNRRGATTRSPDEGGRQERELSDKYKNMSDALKSKWPRTSAILRSLASSYEGEAKRQDISSDLFELR